MDITKINPGDPVELLVNANAIPAGCYRFIEVHGEISVFSVGREVIIGLATDFWTKFMRPAADSGARLSSEAEFATGYKTLCARLETSSELTDPSKLTFCMITPRVLELSNPQVESMHRPVRPSELVH